MTEQTVDPTAADLPEAEPEPYVSPLPPPPADGRPAPEEWLTDYLRGELALTGMTLTDEEFASTVEMNRLPLQYPGRYVVTRDHHGIRDGGWYVVREEVLFHAADPEACEAYIRSRPEPDRRSLTYTYAELGTPDPATAVGTE